MLRQQTGFEVQQDDSRQSSVLVVEDDSSIRRLVAMVLKRAGYLVEQAEDGVEAVLKLGLCEYDVIILDLMMPNLDGFTLINTIAAEDPSRLKSIIITSAASPAMIAERMKGVPYDLLRKPFDIDDLASRVQACIDSRRTGAS